MRRAAPERRKKMLAWLDVPALKAASGFFLTYVVAVRRPAATMYAHRRVPSPVTSCASKGRDLLRQSVWPPFPSRFECVGCIRLNKQRIYSPVPPHLLTLQLALTLSKTAMHVEHVFPNTLS